MGQEAKNKSLIAAAQSGSVALVKSALASGAEVDAVDAVFSRTVLMHASCSGNAECVRLLLAAGADVNAVYDGWSALISAASKGKIECVKLLIEAGADQNYKDRHNYSAFTTPLTTAISAASRFSVPPVPKVATRLITLLLVNTKLSISINPQPPRNG